MTIDLTRVNWGDGMKISEKGRKILEKVWGIYTLIVVVLSFLSLFGVLYLPRAVDSLLWSVLWLGMGVLTAERKLAILWCILAAMRFGSALILFFK